MESQRPDDKDLHHQKQPCTSKPVIDGTKQSTSQSEFNNLSTTKGQEWHKKSKRKASNDRDKTQYEESVTPKNNSEKVTKWTGIANKGSMSNNNHAREQKCPIVYEDIMEASHKGILRNAKKKSKAHNKAQELKTKMNANGNEREEKEIEMKSTNDNKAATYYNVIVLGDSMIKNLQGWRMKTSLKSREKVVIRSFPGVSTDDLSFHVVSSMKRNQRSLVLHTGTNDFQEGKDDDQIAKSISGLAKTLKTDENTVYVSGMI